jgi:hypothetical protein
VSNNLFDNFEDNIQHLLFLVFKKIPQLFQLKFYAINRRLRKILKNGRRYRRVFCYVKHTKRIVVLGRFLKPFFQFSKQRSYKLRVKFTLNDILNIERRSPVLQIYQKQQIGVLSSLLLKG